jgi:FSR family fosmidomycin resistance protein-like MFS transporter
MGLLLDKLFSSVALGHLTVDMLNGQRAVLLTYLSIPLGLSNAALGLYNTLYQVGGSILQPAFGFLTDRIGARWVTAVGVIWLGAFFSLALLTPGLKGIYLLVLASLGSAAFHPAGTMQATMRGRTHFSGRETTSASFFFVFGQTGLFFGPMVGGPLLDRFGPVGLLAISGLAFPSGINAAYQLGKERHASGVNPQDMDPVPQPDLASSNPKRVQHPGRVSKWSFKLSVKTLPLLAFALMAALQAWGQQNMVTFVPKYLSDLGQPASIYGLIAALFMGGSAIGNVVGGSLADRYGKRRVAAISLALAVAPLYLVSVVGWSFWLYLLIPLAGILTGSTNSIMVVLAQRMIPGGMALASGLILGFMFSSGAMGTLLSGYLADIWGLAPIFKFTAGIALVASLLALSLQRT